MSQVHEGFIADMLKHCERGEHPPLTVWEAQQLLTLARLALASPDMEQRAPAPVFHRLVVADDARMEAEEALTNILGIDLLGISFDPYDGSFEIYPDGEVADVEVTQAQHDAILALGCSRYWINFPDATERYGQGERKKSSSNRWEAHNHFADRRRSMEQRAGFVMVPVEPTEQMLTAASVTRARRDEANLYRHEVAAIYGAMLAAAPPIEALEGGKTDLGASGPVHQDTSSTPASALDRHQFDYGPYGYQCKRCGAIWSEFNGMNTNGPCRRS